MFNLSSRLVSGLGPKNSFILTQLRFATKKAAGSTKNGRDSIGKRLGVKILGDQPTQKGCIIIRQRGLTYRPGENVGLGRDYTIYSMIDGYVRFSRDHIRKKTVVNVTSEAPVERRLREASIAK